MLKTIIVNLFKKMLKKCVKNCVFVYYKMLKIVLQYFFYLKSENITETVKEQEDV
jgi:hypothetical protein